MADPSASPGGRRTPRTFLRSDTGARACCAAPVWCSQSTRRGRARGASTQWYVAHDRMLCNRAPAVAPRRSTTPTGGARHLGDHHAIPPFLDAFGNRGFRMRSRIDTQVRSATHLRSVGNPRNRGCPECSLRTGWNLLRHARHARLRAAVRSATRFLAGKWSRVVRPHGSLRLDVRS